MRALRRFLIRLVASIARRGSDARLSEEIEQHIDQQTADNVRAGLQPVVLSDGFWRTQFGGDPNVLGRTVTLSGEPYTIVGIMPADASVASWPPMAADVWVPLALPEEQRANRGNHNLGNGRRSNSRVARFIRSKACRNRWDVNAREARPPLRIRAVALDTSSSPAATGVVRLEMWNKAEFHCLEASAADTPVVQLVVG